MATVTDKTTRAEAGRTMVEMEGIVKRFGDATALDGVDVEFKSGQIHALLGENGAGKTTLMNILFGLLRPDAGSVRVDGAEVAIESPDDAMRAGIGMVHQHFKLVPTLTVAENVALGSHGSPILRRRELKQIGRELSELGERYGMAVDPEAYIWQLSVGQQQRVEILRALHGEARVLILDEPTAMLTPSETEVLFPKLRAMANEGVAIVFITHHLEDVIQWADEITVLRNGSRVGDALSPGDTSVDELARLMVGRNVDLMRVVSGEAQLAGDETTAHGGIVLVAGAVSATDDRGLPALKNVSLAVGTGEIHAVIGVEGNGQAELEEVLMGLRRPTSGTVEIKGTDVTTWDVCDRLKLGFGIVPSDRYRRGVISALSVADNLVYDCVDREPYGGPWSLRTGAIRDNATRMIERYSIRVSGGDQLVGTLSGGNAQRVVLARTLEHDLDCLLAAQPTRGLDVGAIQFTWEQLEAARSDGIGILLISTDLDEVMSLADRCSVLYRGEIVAGFTRSELDRDAIGLAMGGVRDGNGRSDSEVVA